MSAPVTLVSENCLLATSTCGGGNAIAFVKHSDYQELESKVDSLEKVLTDYVEKIKYLRRVIDILNERIIKGSF